MTEPKELAEIIKSRIGRRGCLAFGWTFLIGMLIHLPVMLSDFPNHDGLSSMYFDQNMITSGRWFLTVACGFSSYFTVPWVIGLLGMGLLGLTAMALAELLELKSDAAIILCGGILVAFPALASTFAYVFTLDGYMMAMLLAVLSVLLTKKYSKGFLAGALCLAFSMGIYQAYLPFAILLCIYQVLLLFADGAPQDGKNSKRKISEEKLWRKKVLSKIGSYFLMGVLGAVLYYVILRVLLLIQGKELASYQGIGEAGVSGGEGLISGIKSIYRDFVAFTCKGGILFQNVFSLAAVLCLLLLTIYVLAVMATKGKWWKKPGFYLILAALVASLPVCTSCIRLVSPELNYHLLMRYQWVLFPICMLAFCDTHLEAEGLRTGKFHALGRWCLIGSALVILFCYGLVDNIAYTNLAKKYEKTYAYCLRLLDRIEQTPGYYQGIPVALVGVVGDDPYPVTEITGDVTSNMIGLSGDMLFYTGENYEAFIKNYLGATLHMVDVETMGEIYYTEEYMEMDSFPGESSTKVVNGILYVKTENSRR